MAHLPAPRVIAAVFAAVLACGSGATAQPVPQGPSPQQAEIENRQAEKAARAAELKAIEERLAANSEQRRKLEEEVASLRADRARLNNALLQTTTRAQEVESRIAGLESRLATLTGAETAIRRSLEGRRGLIGDVLAALQRMGRRPPPAVMVRPEDMLEAVRASILLGAVVPELRQEIETLGVDLAELVRLREQIAADRSSIGKELERLAGERQRLASLVEARRQREQAASQDIEAEKKQAAALAEQARSLREFVERIEKEIASSTRAAEAARQALESQSREARERLAALAFKDPARLQPRIAFAEARGLLPLPASGAVQRGFGTGDGSGGVMRGISMATRPGAVVSAPADGWVAYAGPFRSFGQLLILNAGGGYYLLLAGLQRIDVTLGQFVLAGEPVGAMGEGSDAALTPLGSMAASGPASQGAGASAAGNVATNDPVLYIEFRKDGVAIDPGPWWAKTDDRKVRG